MQNLALAHADCVRCPVFSSARSLSPFSASRSPGCSFSLRLTILRLHGDPSGCGRFQKLALLGGAESATRVERADLKATQLIPPSDEADGTLRSLRPRGEGLRVGCYGNVRGMLDVVHSEGRESVSSRVFSEARFPGGGNTELRRSDRHNTEHE